MATAPAPTNQNLEDAILEGAPTVKPLTDYLSLAQTQLDAGYSAVTNDTTAAYTAEAAGYTNLAAQQKAQEPLVKASYAALAADLQNSQGVETQNAQQTGQQNIGAAKASGAASGLSDAQGAFKTPITAAQNDLQSKLATISTTYNVKQDDLTQQLNASVEQLETQAAQYEQQGLSVQAEGAKQMASMAYEHQQQIDSLAQQFQAADTTAAKQAFTEYIDLVKQDQTNQRLDLQEQTLANTEQVDQQRLGIEAKSAGKTSVSPVTTNSAGGLNFTNGAGSPITASDYAKLSGQSLVSLLSQSKDPTDKEFIKNYKVAQQQVAAGTATAGEANASLQSMYPNITGNNTLF